MNKKAKTALKAVILAKVELWNTERAYEIAVGREIKSFEAVSEFAVCAEDVTDADLEVLAAQFESEAA